jgi:hypothetical protein
MFFEATFGFSLCLQQLVKNKVPFSVFLNTISVSVNAFLVSVNAILVSVNTIFVSVNTLFVSQKI